MTLTRMPRKFRDRSPEERSWIQKNTWCDTCALPDLGMDDIVEYQEGTTIYVEGKCVSCGSPVRAIIEYRDTP
jgi:hypothetical protein